MVLEYTSHALWRMKQRAVPKASVEDAVKSPDFSFITGLGRFTALKRYNEKLLKVVYEKSNDKITVVTVYWTKRVR